MLDHHSSVTNYKLTQLAKPVIYQTREAGYNEDL